MFDVSCADFVKVPALGSALSSGWKKESASYSRRSPALGWQSSRTPARDSHCPALVGPTTLRTGLAGLARRTHDGRQGGGRERASEAKCSFRVLIWSKSPPGRVLGVDPLRECELLPPFTRARVNLSLHVDHDDDDVQSTHPQSVCTAAAACRILPQGVEKKHDNV